MNYNLYFYKATVTKIVDGDTVYMDVDLGLDVHTKKKFRLYGIDAYEIRGEERPMGLKAKELVQSLIPVGTEVIIETYRDKTGKYGRYLANIILPDGDTISEKLLDASLAELYLP